MIILHILLVLFVSAWTPARAAEFAVVTAAANTSTGTQDFTVSGFGTPKCALGWIGYGTANGTAVDNAMLAFGGTDGTRSRTQSVLSEDNIAASDTGYRGDATNFLTTQLSTDQSVDATATFDSWITDGIRINWTDAPPSGYLVTIVLIGGTGVSNCYVNNASAPGTVDTATDVTDPGFEPDLVVTWGSGTGSITTDGSSMFSMGWALNDGSDTQRSYSFHDLSGANPTQNALVLDENSVLRRAASGSGGSELQIANFDASGFDLFSRVSIVPTLVTNYMAIKFNGIAAHVRTWNSPTSTGDHTLTGVPWQPQFGLMLHGTAITAGTAETDGDAEVFGISAFTASASSTSSISGDDAVTPSNTESITDNKPVRLRNGNADFMTATMSGWTSDGVTFNYSATDGTARLRALLLIQAGAASAVRQRGAVMFE